MIRHDSTLPVFVLPSRFSLRSVWRLLSTSVAALALTSCLEIAAIETASLILSGKTIVDHTTSAIFRRDCSIVYTEQERYYCKAKPTRNIDFDDGPQPPFCYPSLGEVTCYQTPEPDSVSEALRQ